MRQLSLNINLCLGYAPEGFWLHAGVEKAYQACHAMLRMSGFRLCFITGPRRSGKTHFSIKLVDDLLKQGLRPRLTEGDRLGESAFPRKEHDFSSQDIIVVDEAETYLTGLGYGNSGEFVTFIERLRVARGAVVFFSAHELEHFSLDDHIRSRLISGSGFRIGNPHPEDLPELIRLMARQRGFLLDPRKLEYLIKRIGRSIPAIEEYLEKLISLSRVRAQPVRFPMLGDAIGEG